MAKLKQMKINKCHKIIREIVFNVIFIWVLFVISYTNRNENSFNYKNRIQNSFAGYKNVIINLNLTENILITIHKAEKIFYVILKVKNVKHFWKWVSNDFLSNLVEHETIFNASIRSTYLNFDHYLNDASSILIGYPIIRQLRIQKGTKVFTLYEN